MKQVLDYGLIIEKLQRVTECESGSLVEVLHRQKRITENNGKKRFRRGRF